jgi:hypothetical protein
LEQAPRLVAVSARSIGPQIVTVLEHFQGAPALDYVDVRDNKMADEGLMTLVTVAKHSKTLTRIAFDGSGVSSLSVLTQFAQELDRCPRSFLVHFPAEDVRRLTNDLTEISLMKKRFARFSEQREEDEWLEPFDICQFASDAWPLYLSSEVRAALARDVDLVTTNKAAKRRQPSASDSDSDSYSPPPSGRSARSQRSVTEQSSSGRAAPSRRLQTVKRAVWEFPFPSVRQSHDEELLAGYQKRFALKKLVEDLTNAKLPQPSDP